MLDFPHDACMRRPVRRHTMHEAYFATPELRREVARARFHVQGSALGDKGCVEICSNIRYGIVAAVWLHVIDGSTIYPNSANDLDKRATTTRILIRPLKELATCAMQTNASLLPILTRTHKALWKPLWAPMGKGTTSENHRNELSKLSEHVPSAIIRV